MWFWEEHGAFLFLETLHLIETRDKENDPLMNEERGLALGIFLSRWTCWEPTHQHTRNHSWQMLRAKAFPVLWLSSWGPDASQSFLKSTAKRSESSEPCPVLRGVRKDQAASQPYARHQTGHSLFPDSQFPVLAETGPKDYFSYPNTS